MIKLFKAIYLKGDLFKELLFAIFFRSDYGLLYKADILLVCHDVNRSYLWRGSAYSPLMDSLREKLEIIGLTTLSLAKPISRLSGSDTSSNVLAVNRQYVKYKILEKILRGLFGLNELTFWKKIIQKTRPKCIIAIQPSPALSAAGKKTSIRVFDLQHGIIEPSVYYNLDLEIEYGLAGYPDGILVWDHVSKEAASSSLPGIQALIIGNMWLERFLYPTSSDQLVEDAERRVETIYLQDSTVILVSLQWGRESISEIIIPDIVSRSLINLSNEGWIIWIRFHPIQLQKLGSNTLKSLFQAETSLNIDGSKIVDVSHHALPALLKRAALHLTGHSAVAIDASLMGVPTLLWRNDCEVRSWFKFYMENGLVQILDSDGNALDRWAHKYASKFGELRTVKILNSSNAGNFLRICKKITDKKII